MKVLQIAGRIAPAVSAAIIGSIILACSDTPGPERISGLTPRRASAVASTAALPSVNECASPRSGWVFCDDFEVDRLSSYYEYNNGGGKFVRTSATGVSGSVGMRGTYTAGSTSAGGLSLAFGRTPSSYFRPADAGTSNYREIYWRFFVRRESGWVGNGSGKLTRATIFAKSDWSQAMIAHGWTSDTDDRYLMIDPASGTDAAGNVTTAGYNDFSHLKWIGGVRSAGAEEDQSAVGDWKCYEYHVKLNDAGQSNGLFEFSIDEQLSASRTGMNWVGAYNAYGINAILLEQFQNQGAPAANKRTMDNFVVSTRPIGCGASVVVPPAPAPVAKVAVSLQPSSIDPGQTAQATATTSDASGNVLTGRSIVWSSSNSSVATVDASGLVTAVSSGSATITASSEGQSAGAVIDVIRRTAGLVAAYGFGETSGTTTADASGNSNIGSLGRGVTRTASGRFGAGLAFDGSGMVTVANAATLALTSGMTLEAWVNPSVVSSSWRDVVYKGNDNYFLMATSDNSSRPSGGGIFAPSSSTTQAYGTTKLAVNTWTHLAVTYDGKTLRTYVNGTAASSVARTGLIKTSTRPLQIGGDELYGQFFKGTLDEVRVYNRALSAAEVKTDMNTAIGDMQQPTLPPAPPVDKTAPVVRIVGPTAAATYTVASSSLTVTGTASDSVGVTQVRWTNNRGGSGMCSGTSSWAAAAVALQPGTNVVTMTAQDAANNVANAVLTIVRDTTTTPPPPPPPTATSQSITTQPSATAQSGVAFGQQPVIQLRDASNNAVSQSGVVVTAAIASGTGTLGGTATATTNVSGVASFSNLSITGSGAHTLRFSASGLTSATSNTTTVSAPPSGGGSTTEPMPSGTMFLDTRAGGAQDIQKVNDIAGVRTYWTATGGLLNDVGFTTNYNGAGKHAFRVDWKANSGGESSYNDNMFYFPSSSVVYASVVIHLGKTATGGGLGSDGSFIPVTNGGGMKRMMWLRQKDNVADRIYWNWPATGQGSQQNALSIDSRNYNSYFNADYGVGTDVRWTFQLIAGNPGTLRVWRNGVLVNENTNAGIGTLGFAEFQFITTRFSTSQAETEYWTDLVVWKP